MVMWERSCLIQIIGKFDLHASGGRQLIPYQWQWPLCCGPGNEGAEVSPGSSPLALTLTLDLLPSFLSSPSSHQMSIPARSSRLCSTPEPHSLGCPLYRGATLQLWKDL